jgi:hypothetical protein
VRGQPLGHRVGDAVTYLPLVVRTRSPSIVGRVVAPADRYGPQAFFINVQSS